MSDVGRLMALRAENALLREKLAAAMGIDWMNRAELAQAIPPAYTQFIGEQLMEYLR